MIRRIPLLIGIVGISTLVGTTVWFVWYGRTPWTPTGRLVVAIRTVPNPLTQEHSLALGIDDVKTRRQGEDYVRVSTLTRRVDFDTKQNSVTTLLDTEVQTGVYTDLSFTLTSPALKNAWEQETAPKHVALLFDHIDLPSTFTITEGITTVILLGFETTQALHPDGENFIYLPVIQVETRSNATVMQESDGRTRVEGGVIEQNSTYGMDWDGRIRVNYRAKNKPAEETTTTYQPYAPENEVVDETEAESEDENEEKINAEDENASTTPSVTRSTSSATTTPTQTTDEP